MRVSVIIPNYNHAPYLPQRIDSVLNQTFRDFEIIILDDCSTDNSKQIIEQYRHHPQVTNIIYNESNSGSPFAQWEKGINLAQGEWIWIAESDDWCEPGFLAEVLRDDPRLENVVLSFCGSVKFHENKILSYSGLKQLGDILSGKNFVKAFLVAGNTISNASMCVFRKHAWTYDMPIKEYSFSGDWACWIKIALQGDVMMSGKHLNYFRKHGGDVSGKSFKNGAFHLEYIKIQQLLLDAKIIHKKEFYQNVFMKSLSISSLVDSRHLEEVRNAYSRILGYRYYRSILLLYIFRKLAVLKKLFAREV